MKFYYLPTSSFGLMLSNGIIVATLANTAKIKIVAVTEKIIVNQYLLEIVSSEFQVHKSRFGRKFFFFLLKVNFLILNEDTQLNEKVFFQNLFKAQRHFRKNLLPKYKSNSIAEVFVENSRPTIIFASRTDDYWNSINNRTENRISIRNSNLRWTEEVIELLLIKGFNVIRLGTQTNLKLQIVSPYFLDYSLSNFRSDENDFEICRFADLAVTTGGGISLLPSLLGIPGIMVNSGLFTDIQPQEYLHHYLPKSVFYKNGGPALSSAELAHLQLNAMQQDFDYDRSGLELREVSSNDSLTAILDFYNVLKAKNVSRKFNIRKMFSFNTIPAEIREQFPEDITEPETGFKISIQIHKFWRNF